MCSIVGAAGPIDKLPSRKKQEFHELLSCMFSMAEIRGRDAAGFWVWRGDHYVFEKRPGPAQDLIARSMRWKSLRFNPGQLYLLHTRAATDGDPNENINNHPHIGDFSVMVHNGCLWSHQQICHNYGLDTISSCDSETLLRLVEKFGGVKDGLKKAFKIAQGSSGTATIACAFIDRRNPDRIYLARNHGNPCYVYESKRFKATFFASKEEIAERAVELMYNKDVKVEDILGAPKNVTPFYLYELKADGTYSDKWLTSTTTTQSYVGRRHDWEEYADTDPFAVGKTQITGFQMDILGNLTEIVDFEETSKNEINESLDLPVMPSDVAEDLASFLTAQVEED